MHVRDSSILPTRQAYPFVCLTDNFLSHQTGKHILLSACNSFFFFLSHQARISICVPVIDFSISTIKQAHTFLCISQIFFSPNRQAVAVAYLFFSHPSGKNIILSACHRFFYLIHQSSIPFCVPVRDFFSISPIQQAYSFVCLSERFFLTQQSSITL